MDKGFRFGPASITETSVYGAQRPGYPAENVELTAVEEWVSFMRSRKIKRVVCLLPEEQLEYYRDATPGLLNVYAETLGKRNVLHSPIKDYRLCGLDALVNQILPFLRASDVAGEKVVVHCSGGSGRTGHVLAAWLAFRRGCDPVQALDAVRQASSPAREPCEAVACGNATKGQLMRLLEEARAAGASTQGPPAVLS
jgi:protein-tyrosine phosphatase